MTEPDRHLPNNLEAERAVLGALLVFNDAYDTVSAIVRAPDFFREAHRTIYAAVARQIDQAGGRADVVTLRDALERTGTLEAVGGAVYIAGLVDGVPRSANAGHYARIVKEKAQLRAAIRTLGGLVNEAYTAERSAAEIIQAADKFLVELQANNGRGNLLELVDTQKALFDDLEWRHAHAGEVTGVTTGFALIDEMTLGWQPGDLVVIGARPSIGKTTFVMNGATAAARAGKRTAVFSLEMRRQQLEYRMLSSLSGVPLTRVLSGRFMDPDWGKLATASGQMQHFPLWINDAASLSVWDIRSECRRLRAETGLDLVVIDYVQLVAGSSDRRGTNRTEEVSDISRRLKALAGELQVPILLLSQLSRAGTKRVDPWPQLSDLRESGALEQDADIVAFLHRKNHREGGLTHFIMAKQRNGATGTFQLSLDRDIVTFTDWEGPTPEEPTPEVKPRSRRAAPPKQVRI